MNRIFMALAAATLLAGRAAAAEKALPTPNGKAGPVTVEGELIDMSCYLVHGAKGEKHVKCANACISGGAPMGVLGKNDKVYLLVADHGNEKPYVDAKSLAGARARITGRVVKRSGLQALVVSKTERP